MKYSSFKRRLGAYLLDSLVTAIPFNTVSSIIGLDMLTYNGLYLLLWTAYIVWMNGKYGATIGKMILNMKIVKENGKPLTYSDAFVREIASYLSVTIFGIGCFVVIWDKKKQSWHDKIAKTVVISTKKGNK